MWARRQQTLHFFKVRIKHYLYMLHVTYQRRTCSRTSPNYTFYTNIIVASCILSYYFLCLIFIFIYKIKASNFKPTDSVLKNNAKSFHEHGLKRELPIRDLWLWKYLKMSAASNHREMKYEFADLFSIKKMSEKQSEKILLRVTWNGCWLEYKLFKATAIVKFLKPPLIVIAQSFQLI